MCLFRKLELQLLRSPLLSESLSRALPPPFPVHRSQSHGQHPGLSAFQFRKNGHEVLVTSSSVKEVDFVDQDIIDKTFVFGTDIQLASREDLSETREVDINGKKIGGAHNNTLIIAGPCSVESKSQITESAELLKELGISTLRAGRYKPRTSPYSFQGLGLEGLQLLAEMREKYKLNIIRKVFTGVEDLVVKSTFSFGR